MTGFGRHCLFPLWASLQFENKYLSTLHVEFTDILIERVRPCLRKSLLLIKKSVGMHHSPRCLQNILNNLDCYQHSVLLRHAWYNAFSPVPLGAAVYNTRREHGLAKPFPIAAHVELRTPEFINWSGNCLAGRHGAAPGQCACRRSTRHRP